MWPTQIEIKTAVGGAFKLAKGDVSALEQFDFSFEGFWKSFFAAVLVLPLYFIALYDQHTRDTVEIGTTRLVFVEGISYALGWALFPIIAILIVRVLDRGPRYVPLIVVSNWGSVPQACVLVGGILLGTFFPAGSGVVGFLMLLAFLVTLVYQWFLIRVSLQVRGMISLGILFFYLILNYWINQTAEGFLYAGAGAG